ncbi:MAG: fructose-1,6-bisphosphate aldolase, class II [Parcubacteria group bacterium CG1_02_58_44]|nr:MAG: fructose-1,6-bisphosphate aldolase, class II [Parcubacteria group bacterium CG1_02_58_44]
MLTTLKKILSRAERGGYAVGAFNVNNLEILQAVIETAVEERSPVIIQTSEGAIEYAGLDYLVAMVRLAAKSPVPVVLHLDHGKDLKLIKRAIAAGYTSVMYDGSLLPYRQNVADTRRVVSWAKLNGISVEAEIGAIKGIEDLVTVDEKRAFFTDPEEAQRFAKETGCDALAVSVGTAHGAYKFKREAKLDIARLKKIDQLVRVPLVLHGASEIDQELVRESREYCERLGDCGRLKGAKGVPDGEIRRAIKAGVRKINIDSDLRLAFTVGLRQALTKMTDEIDPRKLLAPSKELMKATVRDRMRVFGCSGKA